MYKPVLKHKRTLCIRVNQENGRNTVNNNLQKKRLAKLAGLALTTSWQNWLHWR